jgi:hypothetical protein
MATAVGTATAARSIEPGMSIIEFIQDRARYYNCPVCGRSLRGCEVRMLNHVEDRFTVQVTCAACHVTFIVVLAIQGTGIDSNTDDDMQVDVDELAASVAADRPGPIEPDELLDLHLLLKSFDGPIVDLLKQPESSR